MERPPFETDEATEGIEDEVGIVEEAVEDGNRSPDSIIFTFEQSCGGWDSCLLQMGGRLRFLFLETPTPPYSYYYFCKKSIELEWR